MKCNVKFFVLLNDSLLNEAVIAEQKPVDVELRCITFWAVFCFAFLWVKADSQDKYLLKSAESDTISVQETLDILALIDSEELNTRDRGRFYYLQGWSLRQQNRIPKSISNYLDSYEQYKSIFFKRESDKKWIVDILNNVAAAYEACQNHKLAIKFQEEAISWNSRYFDNNNRRLFYNLYNLGLYQGNFGDFKNGIDNIKLSLQFAPKIGDSIQAYNTLGWIYLQNNSIDIARQYLDIAISQASEDRKALRFKGMALMNLGELQIKTGHIEEAHTSYLAAERYLKKGEDLFYLYQNIGSLHESIDLNKSVAYYLKAIKEPYPIETIDRIQLMAKLLKFSRDTLSLQDQLVASLDDLNKTHEALERSYLVHASDLVNEKWETRSIQGSLEFWIRILVLLTLVGFAYFVIRKILDRNLSRKASDTEAEYEDVLR